MDPRSIRIREQLVSGKPFPGCDFRWQLSSGEELFDIKGVYSRAGGFFEHAMENVIDEFFVSHDSPIADVRHLNAVRLHVHFGRCGLDDFEDDDFFSLMKLYRAFHYCGFEYPEVISAALEALEDKHVLAALGFVRDFGIRVDGLFEALSDRVVHRAGDCLRITSAAAALRVPLSLLAQLASRDDFNISEKELFEFGFALCAKRGSRAHDDSWIDEFIDEWYRRCVRPKGLDPHFLVEFRGKNPDVLSDTFYMSVLEQYTRADQPAARVPTPAASGVPRDLRFASSDICIRRRTARITYASVPYARATDVHLPPFPCKYGIAWVRIEFKMHINVRCTILSDGAGEASVSADIIHFKKERKRRGSVTGPLNEVIALPKLASAAYVETEDYLFDAVSFPRHVPGGGNVLMKMTIH